MSMRTLLTLAAAAALSACGAGPTATVANAPDWVDDPTSMGICQTGSQAPTGLESHDIEMATASGRKELGAFLETRVASMLKDTTTSTIAGGPDGVRSKALEKTMASFQNRTANVPVNGTSRKKRWVSPKGTTHALVCMDKALLKQALVSAVDGIEALSADEKSEIRKVFDEEQGKLDAMFKK